MPSTVPHALLRHSRFYWKPARYSPSGSAFAATLNGPAPSPRSPFFFLFAGYTFSAAGGASADSTSASIARQYFTSAGRAEDTVWRIPQYHSDHSSSFLFLFAIAVWTLRTSDGSIPLSYAARPRRTATQENYAATLSIDTGRNIVNTVPLLPSRWLLFTFNLPLCRPTISWLIHNPNPVPPKPLVV
jgi:hypothetical protein